MQLNTIASNQGRAWPPPTSEWDNSATVGVGGSVLVDGAKRDRTVWPGDLGIAVPTQYAYSNDLASTRNALTTMYNAQSTDGEIPWSGPPFNLTGSDTYHTWTLLGTATYYTYSADRAWLDSEWADYKRGMAFISNKIDGNNLLNVTRTQDWARVGQGGENVSANALLYAALKAGAALATIEGDSSLAASWTGRAAAIKTAANSLLWDSSKGMYKDNPTSGLYPQDGNSLAVWYGLTDSTAKSRSIITGLGARWGAYGPTTPEWGGNVSPFAGGMELNARFTANDDYGALAQIRRTWGHMLNSDIGTKSTFWEGIKADGGLAYGGSFMSLAHGWSTAPTSTLTFDVLGTAPESATGAYHFVPHAGDLTSAQGRITMPQGAVDASWSRAPAAGTYTAHLTSPAGTTGRIGVPKFGGGNLAVSVNGNVVWSNGAFTPTGGITGASQDDAYVYLTGVAPGSYTVTATGLGNPRHPPSRVPVPCARASPGARARAAPAPSVAPGRWPTERGPTRTGQRPTASPAPTPPSMATRRRMSSSRATSPTRAALPDTPVAPPRTAPVPFPATTATWRTAPTATSSTRSPTVPSPAPTPTSAIPSTASPNPAICRPRAGRPVAGPSARTRTALVRPSLPAGDVRRLRRVHHDHGHQRYPVHRRHVRRPDPRRVEGLLHLHRRPTRLCHRLLRRRRHVWLQRTADRRLRRTRPLRLQDFHRWYPLHHGGGRHGSAARRAQDLLPHVLRGRTVPERRSGTGQERSPDGLQRTFWERSTCDTPLTWCRIRQRSALL
ncbi:hypothetical protein ACFQ51_48230 [Streptomyces kaempferi]